MDLEASSSSSLQLQEQLADALSNLLSDAKCPEEVVMELAGICENRARLLRCVQGIKAMCLGIQQRSRKYQHVAFGSAMIYVCLQLSCALDSCVWTYELRPHDLCKATCLRACGRP